MGALTTIGVAIAVPEPWGSALQAARRSFGDPLADAVPTHVTLVPPTPVADLDAVQEHLTAVASQHAPFRLWLRGTGTFRPVSPVVFVAIAEGISSCEVVAADVRTGPLAQSLSFPYHPHVTVAHNVDDDALDRAFATLEDFECTFDVDVFHLFVHGDDEVWRPHTSFELTAPTHRRRSS